MNLEILRKSYDAPPVCEREILRYAGCKGMDADVEALLHTCLEEVQSRLVYKVCYRELPVCITDDLCDFEAFSVRSEKLAKNLSGCESVMIFGATVGVEIDRLIAKYGRISPAKALMMQAIGAERIEELCDLFCEDYAKEYCVHLKPRFSPGYGDLALDVQKELFRLLDAERKIGLFLNESLLMSPSKSVTAFAGITDTAVNQTKCEQCDNKACSFRSAK